MVASGIGLRPRRVGILAGAAVAMGAMVAQAQPVLALVLPSLIAALALAVLVRHLIVWRDDPHATNKVMRWTLLAFGVHLAFGLAVSNFGALRGFLAIDSITYHRGAVALLNHWRAGSPYPHLPRGKEGFFYLLAGIYWFVGSHPVAGLAVNAALGAAVIPVMTQVTWQLAGARAARRVPALLMVLPGFLVWDSQLLREPGVILLIALGAYFALRAIERTTAGNLMGLTLSVALLLTFRGYLAPLIGGALLCGVAVGKRQLLSGVGAGLSALAIAAVLTLALGLGYSGFHLATTTNLQQANIVRKGLSSGVSSGYGFSVDVSTPKAALSYLPLGFVISVLGPFPWQVHGVRQLPAIPDVVVWWFLIPKLVGGYGVVRRGGDRRVFVLVLPSLMVALVLALVIGNYGTLVRERMQVIVPLIPLVAVGWEARDEERRARRSTLRPAAPFSGTASLAAQSD